MHDTIQICEHDNCTACKACVNVCPANAIVMQRDLLNIETAAIDTSKCISCHMCQNVCPQNSTFSGNSPQLCYAAWSTDKKTRFTSASGGIAAELYKLAGNNHMWFAGVKMTDRLTAEFVLTDNKSDIMYFQNSKYVQSNPAMVYAEIAQKLRHGEKVLFIGLPCQVDALRSVCKTVHVKTDDLYLIDLVCHGSAPAIYLQQHIHFLEKKSKKTTTEVSFRDPDTYTYTYTFTLKENGKPFYRRKVHRNDLYQIGYHKGIIYRENCYQCRYAKNRRVGDLTLADFGCVGRIKSCAYDNKNVSCILCNTEKGSDLVRHMIRGGQIYCEERPLEEEISYEPMLNAPRKRPKEQIVFAKNYQKRQDFIGAMRKAAFVQVVRNEIFYYLHMQQIRNSLSRMLPYRVKQNIKKAIGCG